MRQYLNEINMENKLKDNGVHKISRKKGGAGTKEAVAELKDPPQAGLGANTIVQHLGPSSNCFSVIFIE